MKPRHVDPVYAPSITAEPPEWTTGALCLQMDPDLFFPEKGTDVRPAKRVCAGCSVKDPCLVYGMNEAFGIYGGLTARDRRGLRRGARVA